MASSIRKPITRHMTALNADDAVSLLTALAHPWRLEVFRLLTRYLPYGLAAGDIARLIAVPHNTLSAYLAKLEQAGLVHSRRQGRSIVFAAARERALQLASFLEGDLCDVTAAVAKPRSPNSGRPFVAQREASGSGNTYNVLVICTHNSARSIMAEAILNAESHGRFRAFSAGARPRRHPHPLCLTLLDEWGYDIQDFRSKDIDEFTVPDAPRMDLVVTVCDRALDMCPTLPGRPLTAHWGVDDPTIVAGTEAEKRAAFVQSYRRLSARMSRLVNLNVGALSRSSLVRDLTAIGAMDGATEITLQRCNH
jgi:ArsR family transcriptional regulator, arsenate/arsenite/antimonite-responsive transcriptional repressor / arsenate reductase (thioredoxin)